MRATYGAVRDYPKIELFLNGHYVATTAWSRTLLEAIEHYRQSFPLAQGKITAMFKLN